MSSFSSNWVCFVAYTNLSTLGNKIYQIETVKLDTIKSSLALVYCSAFRGLEGFAFQDFLVNILVVQSKASGQKKAIKKGLALC